MIWPTADNIMDAHARALATTGGAPGLRDPGALASAVNRPFAAFGGVALFPEIEHKVAALIEALVRNHPFVDGNKRTAMLVGLATLRLNGLPVSAQDQEIEEIAVAVAEHTLHLSALTAWIARITRRELTR